MKWKQLLDLTALAQQARTQGVPLRKLCSGLISACGKATEWQRSLLLLDACRVGMASMGEAPDTVLYNSALAAIGKGHNWSLACGLLACMEDDQLTPDVVSFSSVLTACERATRWQRALGLLEEVLDHLHPDLLLISSAISACEKGQQWQRALMLLSRAPALHVELDSVSFDTVMSACERPMQWEWVLSLFHKMGEMRVKADDMSYVATVTACSVAKKWQHCLTQLMAMQVACGRFSTSGFALNAALRSTVSEPKVHMRTALLMQRVQGCLFWKGSQPSNRTSLAESLVLAGALRSARPRTTTDWAVERRAIEPVRMLVMRTSQESLRRLPTRFQGLGDFGQQTCCDLLERWFFKMQKSPGSWHVVLWICASRARVEVRWSDAQVSKRELCY